LNASGQVRGQADQQLSMSTNNKYAEMTGL